MKLKLLSLAMFIIQFNVSVKINFYCYIQVISPLTTHYAILLFNICLMNLEPKQITMDYKQTYRVAHKG